MLSVWLYRLQGRSVVKVYAEDLDSFKAPVTYGIHPGIVLFFHLFS